MEKTWRPICYGRQYFEGMPQCDGCPFRFNCRWEKDEHLERMRSKYEEV